MVVAIWSAVGAEDFARSYEIKPQGVGELGTHLNRHHGLLLHTVYH